MIRVLVVDDAPFIREIVRTSLKSEDIEIVAEGINGDDAVFLANKHKPDVILMDIIMPQKSGIEATKEILSKLPKTKIIAFSTSDQEVMIMRALEAGSCSYIVKPFKSEDLQKAVRDALISTQGGAHV